MNLAELMTETAKEHGDRVALKLDDVEVTYEMLDEGSAPRRRAARRRRASRSGDRVGIMLPNVPYFAAIYYGDPARGRHRRPDEPAAQGPRGRLLPLRQRREDPVRLARLRGGRHEGRPRRSARSCILVAPGEFEKLVGDAEPDHGGRRPRRGRHRRPALHERHDRQAQGRRAHAREPAPRTPRSPARCSTSARTTSSSARCRCSTPSVRPAASTRRWPSGGMITLIPRFDPEKALEIIQRDKVTVFEGVPTMFSAMLHSDKATTTSRRCASARSGGSAMPGEVLRELRGEVRRDGARGLRPVGDLAGRDVQPPAEKSKEGSIGIPIDGVELRLVDDDRNEVGEGEVGEIAIRGHNVMKGYWDREEATEEAIDDDGWFYSGDMGKRDEDGYYFIVDRKKELIIRGGYNVYPREIEEVLYEHPAVREVAVVGVPHDELGEEIGAAVALKDGEEVTEEELRDARQGAGRRLQVPAQDLVRRRAAQGPDGQDPQEGRRDPGGGEVVDDLELAEVDRAGGRRPPARALRLRRRWAVASKSTPTDLVSEADLAAEALIRERLAAARPDDGDPGGGGRRRRRHVRAALGRRPARRDRQLPVRHPAVVAVSIALEDGDGAAASSTTRCATSAGRSRAAGRRRCNGEPVARVGPRRISPRRWSPRASATTPRCARSRARSSRGCCRGCATSAGSARRRSTSPGPPPAATTRTSSAASSAGTSPRARCCARRPGSRCASCAPAPPSDDGILVAPRAFAQELFDAVVDALARAAARSRRGRPAPTPHVDLGARGSPCASQAAGDQRRRGRASSRTASRSAVVAATSATISACVEVGVRAGLLAADLDVRVARGGRRRGSKVGPALGRQVEQRGAPGVAAAASATAYSGSSAERVEPAQAVVTCAIRARLSARCVAVDARGPPRSASERASSWAWWRERALVVQVRLARQPRAARRRAARSAAARSMPQRRVAQHGDHQDRCRRATTMTASQPRKPNTAAATGPSSAREQRDRDDAARGGRRRAVRPVGAEHEEAEDEPDGDEGGEGGHARRFAAAGDAPARDTAPACGGRDSNPH